MAGEMESMTVLLVIVSLLVALVGFALLSQATAGVGLLAGAVLIAVYARLAQARDQHILEPHIQADAARQRSVAETYVPPPPSPYTKYAVIAFAVLMVASVIAALMTGS